jgi:hypothetical protein
LPLFATNIGKIGLLPATLSVKVAVFNTYAGGVVMDFGALYEALIEHKPSIPDVGKFRNRLLEDLDKLQDNAKALVPELKKEATRRW